MLANLFLHYALDAWMVRNHPDIPFERYADDGIYHCANLAQAERLKALVEQRLTDCGLALHPDKTKIVYCKDTRRRGDYPRHKFDFLGYTFRPRKSKNRRGEYFVSFSPAVSNKAATAIRRTMRRWALHQRSDKSLEDLAGIVNPALRGWINYYGRFYKSALYPPLRHLDRYLTRWAMRKYKGLKGRKRRAAQWLARIARRQPWLFAHWQSLKATAG